MEGVAMECVLASTCNRTELYYVPRPDSAQGVPVWKIMAGSKKAGAVVNDSHFYSIASLNAVKHLFRVASGIDSMVVGDVQILNQIKDAFAVAQEIGSTGSLLNRLFTSALHVGKRARTETEIGEGAVSVSYAAAELASRIFDDLTKRTALLIGAGDTGKLTAQHLVSKNLGSLLLANRTRERAEELAARLGGRTLEYDQFAEHLASVDIIITAVDASSYILTTKTLRRAMKQRGNKPLFIIDIGVPRNVEPETNTIGNVFLHDIDALTHIVDNNLQRRKNQVLKVEEIILDEVIRFNNWFHSLQVTPTIQELREQFEAIRLSEIEKHLHHFTPEKREEVELLTRRIINKILHTPIVNLKNDASGNSGHSLRERIHLLRQLFGLDRNGSG
jgi:glutamyl-tRNA reductase